METFDSFCKKHGFMDDPDYEKFSPVLAGEPEDSETLEETIVLGGVSIYIFDGLKVCEPAVILDFETVEPMFMILSEFQENEALYPQYKAAGGKF